MQSIFSLCRWIRGAVTVAVVTLAGVSHADNPPASDRSSEWAGTPDSYELPWQEHGLDNLPNPPGDAELRTLFSHALDGPFEYKIDSRSLSLQSDQIFRYTVIIKSASGVSNVFYEGIRCETQQFKTYAYLSEGNFRRAHNPKWKAIQTRGGTAYRNILSEEFVCGSSATPNELQRIIGLLDAGDKEHQRGIKVFRKDPLIDSRD